MTLDWPAEERVLRRPHGKKGRRARPWQDFSFTGKYINKPIMCQFISYFHPLQIHIGSFFLFIEYATYIVFSAPFSEINVYLCRATWRSHTPACLRSTAWRARKRQTRSTQIISQGKTLYVSFSHSLIWFSPSVFLFISLSFSSLSICSITVVLIRFTLAFWFLFTSHFLFQYQSWNSALNF